MEKTKYRADIDGIRAIAVLSVVIFHIRESLLPGGFVGVDIFFVISGYLISSQIYAQVGQGTFSILDFYRRRVKRIAPAMIVVVTVTLFVAQFLMRPQDAERVAESSLSSLLSIANVYFWYFQDTSYFASSSKELPLLHLWSLGVEEQFYLIWPIAVIATSTWLVKKSYITFLAAIAAVSFAAGDYLYPWSSSFAYYMLPTRVGELLLGGIIAHPIVIGRITTISKPCMSFITVVGFTLIIGSIFALSESDIFPGIRAIPPTLGAALLILGGLNGPTFVSKFLEFKPIVFIGLISYSMYLWHWPLIAFVNYGYGGYSNGGAIALFAVTTMFAWLTYRFVETPIRRANGEAFQVIFKHYVAPASFMCIVSLACMKLDGYGLRYFFTDYKQTLEGVRDATKYDYVCQRDVLQTADLFDESCITGTKDPKIEPALLWGDSNATHFVGVLSEILSQYNMPLRNLEVGACPPLA